MELKGKISIITGGSQGIGRSVAERFLEEGAAVIIVARTESDLKRAKTEIGDQGRLEIFTGDISEERLAPALMNFCLETFGKLDILVNNAAVIGPLGPLLENDIREWRRTLEINLLGMAYLLKAALPILKKSPRGKIINFTGGGSVSPNFSAYGSAKAAVIRLTESVAEEIKDTNIDMNVIAPGPTITRIAETIIKRGLITKEHFNASLKKIGDLIVFLASHRSDGLRGRMLSAQYDSIDTLINHKQDITNSDIFTLRRILPKDRGYDWQQPR